MSETELTFWEMAKILEARLEESKKRFDVEAHNFKACPSLNFDSLISAARRVREAEAKRFKHAGSARCPA